MTRASTTVLSKKKKRNIATYSKNRIKTLLKTGKKGKKKKGRRDYRECNQLNY